MNAGVAARSKPLPYRPLGKLAARPRRAPAPESSPAPSFSQVAAASGVTPLAAGERRVPLPKSATSPRAERRTEFGVSDEPGFVEGARRELPASALALLRGTPRATLDLHGLRVAVAERRLSAFLAEESAAGTKLVLVIVGKGRHSPGGAGVLRGAIAEWLSAGAAAPHVLAFRTAPPALGGNGGVLVLLKGDRRR
jgi:DNA-nicking Smr family endonuclease